MLLLNERQDMTVFLVDNGSTREEALLRDRDRLTPGSTGILAPTQPNAVVTPQGQQSSIRGGDNVREPLIGRHLVHLELWFAEKGIQRTIDGSTVLSNKSETNQQ